jgi:large conductance mechanosensitive channel
MKGFLEFIRSQGVAGLAVGFILGGAVAKLVASLVNDIINPILGFFLGAVAGLKDAFFQIGNAKIMWGSFVNTCIDFLVVSLVVYFGVVLLGLNNANNPEKK